MEEAIKKGVSYPLEEVMSEEIKSKPGKGILSPPENQKISLVSQNGWPTDISLLKLLQSNQLILYQLRNFKYSIQKM